MFIMRIFQFFLIACLGFVLSACNNTNNASQNSTMMHSNTPNYSSLKVGDIIQVSGRDVLVLRGGSSPKVISLEPEIYNMRELEQVPEQEIPSYDDWRMISEQIYHLVPEKTTSNSCPIAYNGIGPRHFYRGVEYPLEITKMHNDFKGHGNAWCRNTEQVWNYLNKKNETHRHLFKPGWGNIYGCTRDMNENAYLYRIIYL